MASEAEEEVVVYNEGVNVPAYVTKVIFDASVTEIPGTSRKVGYGVFSHCKQLREVVFNDGLQKIGAYAFCGCSSLERLTLPSTVTEIGYNAFNGCTNLRVVVLNEGLQEIEYWAFCGCTSLERLTVPSTVTEIGYEAFKDCTNLREVILNEGLQKIGNYAFYECSSLTVIKLPSTVNEVGAGAFDYCTNLREVTLNEGLQEIGSGAFHNCVSLQCVKFPSISKRAKNLLEAGQTDIMDKFTVNQHFEWSGGELRVSPEAIRNDNWAAVGTNLEHVLAWISHYELKEATTLFELALWKARIEEMGAGAVTDDERSAWRVDVPGPAKDNILQYLQQTSKD